MVKKYLYRKAYEYVRKINRMSKEKQKGFKAFKSEGKQYDLTDVFKGKNIKNPKTFLKERKKVIKEMTKKKAKGGAIKTGIRKAAELKKKMVEAREKLSKSKPKGSYYKKLEKGWDEERKAREKLKKLGRGFRKGGTVRRKPNKDRYETGGKVKNYQTGGEVKGDSEYLDSQLSMDYAKSILDIARKRKPSGVINQDDINAAKEEFNRSKELQRSRQTDPIPMPKTSKRTLVKPMQKSEPTFTPGPRYFPVNPSRDLPGAGPMRRPEQDRYTIDEGMVIKPTDDYVRRRLGMKEGGSVSSKPKHRGWGKAVKGTIFKGTR